VNIQTLENKNVKTLDAMQAKIPLNVSINMLKVKMNSTKWVGLEEIL
jgi:hypothetical protein